MPQKVTILQQCKPAGNAPPAKVATAPLVTEGPRAQPNCMPVVQSNANSRVIPNFVHSTAKVLQSSTPTVAPKVTAQPNVINQTSNARMVNSVQKAAPAAPMPIVKR